MTPSNLDLARECGATVRPGGVHEVIFPMSEQLDAFAERIRAGALASAPAQSVALPAVMPEPFGYWHQGETDDESDFHLHADSGDVSCESCTKLYSASQVQAMLAQGLAPGWKAVPVEPTPHMLLLASDVDGQSSKMSRAIYRAMLAAAPQPPAARPSPAAVERKPMTQLEINSMVNSIAHYSGDYEDAIVCAVEKHHGIRPISDGEAIK